MTEEKMEILIDRNNMEEAENFMDFVQKLDANSQKDFCQFLQGVRYGLSLAEKRRETVAQTA